MKYINTLNAPKAIGPYSQAIYDGYYLYVSGQIAINPETNTMVKDDVETQTKQVFNNVKAILKEANMSLDNVLKVTLYLKDITTFGLVNMIYETEFNGHKPARSCVEVSNLPKNALVEMDLVAKK